MRRYSGLSSGRIGSLHSQRFILIRSCLLLYAAVVHNFGVVLFYFPHTTDTSFPTAMAPLDSWLLHQWCGSLQSSLGPHHDNPIYCNWSWRLRLHSFKCSKAGESQGKHSCICVQRLDSLLHDTTIFDWHQSTLAPRADHGLLGFNFIGLHSW